MDITPSKSWGGLGALGCTLGFGALHRIPAPLEEPPNAPGETMFATDFDSSNEKASLVPGSGLSTPTPPTADFLVPANLHQFQTTPTSLSAPGTAPPPKRERKPPSRAHHHVAPKSELDEYFEEGEAKSRKADYALTTKPGSGIPPPPPKSSGPPKARTPSPTKNA